MPAEGSKALVLAGNGQRLEPLPDRTVPRKVNSADMPVVNFGRGLILGFSVMSKPHKRTINRVRELVSPYKPAEGRVSDQLIAERREEARCEDTDERAATDDWPGARQTGNPHPQG